jgi:hypothetical protein
MNKPLEEEDTLLQAGIIETTEKQIVDAKCVTVYL